MSKYEHINTIRSYLKDGFIEIPAGARTDLESNGVTIEDFRLWVHDALLILQSIDKAKKLNLIPENVLSNIVSYLNNIRNEVSAYSVMDQTSVNAFASSVNQLEQMIYMLLPYVNLAENLNLQALTNKVTTKLENINEENAKTNQEIESAKRKYKILNDKATKLLRGLSSGVLSKNFASLSKSPWHKVLLYGSGLTAVFAFLLLLLQSHSMTVYLIEGLTTGKFDYKIFVAKWLTTFPYLAFLTVMVLEVRSRIHLQDLYQFRETVASSLESYTESLLNKVEDISDSKEKDIARRMVIEFMISSMTELTKQPTTKSAKNSIGLEFKDIGKANISGE